MTTYPIKIGSLKKGNMISINGQPCKILEIKTLKTGKHGKAKGVISARNLRTGKKVEFSGPVANMAQTFDVTKIDYYVLGYDVGDFVILSEQSDSGGIRKDICIPSGNVGQKLRDVVDDGLEATVTVLDAMGYEFITDIRVIK